MATKIGVISQEHPLSAQCEIAAPKGASIFWFNEIEAVFAYLLQDSLDKLYVDQKIKKTADACTIKYQKLMEQLHPHLELCFVPFPLKTPGIACPRIEHFPTLEILFKNGELKSAFQPIINARSNHPKVHGIECLSRFLFNGQKFAPEFIFNYAAEKLKLTNYDRVCLMQALNLVPHHTLIFVNVRPQTLIGNGFYAWFKALLKKNQLLPEQIVIEVTEQYCNISEQELVEQCQNLKNIGVRLALDDFGSGISNLSMLEIMKPTYIKISGRFIKNMHLDERKQKIVKNILDLAHDFKISTIIESVECEEEWQIAKSLGANLAQGFYFHRPMDKDNIVALFEKPESVA